MSFVKTEVGGWSVSFVKTAVVEWSVSFVRTKVKGWSVSFVKTEVKVWSVSFIRKFYFVCPTICNSARIMDILQTFRFSQVVIVYFSSL